MLAACNMPGSNSSSDFGQRQAQLTDSVQLSWQAATGATQGYLIEQSQDGVNFTQVQSVGAVTSARVSGLNPGQTYYFRIRAYNVVGNSGYSQIVSVTPQ